MTPGDSPAPRPVAIGSRLSRCPAICTLGFRPNFSDYSPREQEQLLQAPKVYFPTAFYADLFNTMGKPTFPSVHTYAFAQDKIRQSALFNMLGIPHPRTHIFYGPRQKEQITRFFDYPFVAKIPRGSARGVGVFLIENLQDLEGYLTQEGPAYIQEYLPINRDMRIVVIGRKIRLAFWRTASASEFRTNVSLGGEISFTPLSSDVHELALTTARRCGWDDVGLDVAQCGSRLYILEGNMKYGTKGFKAAGMNYKELLADLILKGEV